MLKGLEYAPSAARLLRRVRQLDPDVAHVQWLAIPRYDVHWLRRLRAPLGADGARRAARGASATPRAWSEALALGGAGDRPVGARGRAAGGGRRPAREARAHPAPGLRERPRGHAAERRDDPLLRPDPRVQGPRRAPARAAPSVPGRAPRRRRRPARPGRAAAAPGGRARPRRPRRVAARLPARRGDSAADGRSYARGLALPEDRQLRRARDRARPRPAGRGDRCRRPPRRDPRVRRRPRRPARGSRRLSPPRCGSCSTTGRAGEGLRRSRGRPAGADLGRGRRGARGRLPRRWPDEGRQGRARPAAGRARAGAALAGLRRPRALDRARVGPAGDLPPARARARARSRSRCSSSARWSRTRSSSAAS